jgi:hypothetical protein
MLEILRWIFGTIFCISALWIIWLNWQIFWKLHIRKEQNVSSWIPLLGGGIGALGMFTLPVKFISGYWWLPFFLDWGSILGLSHALCWHVRRILKGNT